MGFDVEMIPYTAEAYKQNKYAFVSDYARFWILHKYGGIYFDTDVEVIRPLDEIIAQGNFMGFELNPDGENDPQKYAPRYAFAVNPGVGLGMEKEHPFIKTMLDKYAQLEYETPVFPWGKTIVAYTTEELCKLGLKNVQGIQEVQGIKVYPSEYFSPIDMISGKLHITKNTYTIHRYMGSWGDKRHRSWKDLIRSYIPEWVFYLNNRIKRRRYKIK
jgi:mannosyltransferase OCH1-like enzyme